jgi:hypothetical protein
MVYYITIGHYERVKKDVDNLKSEVIIHQEKLNRIPKEIEKFQTCADVKNLPKKIFFFPKFLFTQCTYQLNNN